ncbi:MAG TPA: hypothetical protein VNN07_11720 [Candidatus Tectomicrobia bacterium]|nr:hypothetical protein [Candidatus Tectomicrobia bacterium]
MLDEAGPTLLLAVLVAAIATAVAYACTRDGDKAIALATAAVTWFCWFGAVSAMGYRLVRATPPPEGEFNIAVIPWTTLGVVYSVHVLRARSLRLLVQCWFVLAAVLIAFPSLLLVRFPFARPPAVAPVPAVSLRPPGATPDIFFVVFDRYAGPDTLRRTYGFDNSELIHYLRERGFHVAESSHANYQRTAPSLAATLNHTLIHSLFTGMEDEADWRPLYGLIRNDAVTRALRALGYETIHAGSWWYPTHDDPHADITIPFAGLPLFFQTVYANTALSGGGITFGGRLDARFQHWAGIHRTVRGLRELRRGPRPVFLFAHLLLPHSPYVFGPGGEFLLARTTLNRSTVENYVDQIRFANVVIRQLVEAFLSDTGRPTPVIILQADEGPFPPRDDFDINAYDWRRARPDEVRDKFSILNAMYLPGDSAHSLGDAINPVNTFRVIFNRYFGTRFELLPDQSFGSARESRPYAFFEVTDVLRPRAR